MKLTLASSLFKSEANSQVSKAVDFIQTKVWCRLLRGLCSRYLCNSRQSPFVSVNASNGISLHIIARARHEVHIIVVPFAERDTATAPLKKIGTARVITGVLSGSRSQTTKPSSISAQTLLPYIYVRNGKQPAQLRYDVALRLSN